MEAKSLTVVRKVFDNKQRLYIYIYNNIYSTKNKIRIIFVTLVGYFSVIRNFSSDDSTTDTIQQMSEKLETLSKYFGFTFKVIVSCVCHFY